MAETGSALPGFACFSAGGALLSLLRTPPRDAGRLKLFIVLFFSIINNNLMIFFEKNINLLLKIIVYNYLVQVLEDVLCW